MTALAGEYLEKGLKAQQAGDLAAARRDYGRALEADPENPEALHLLGLAETEAGRAEAGLSLLERAVVLDPFEPLFRINLARAHFRRRDFARAAEELKTAARLAPDDRDVLFELGVVEQAAGNFVAALNIFEGLAREAPRNFDLLLRFGDCAMFTGDAAKTIAAANRLHEIAPERPEPLRLAAGAAIIEKNWLEAERRARQWTTKFPQDANGWRILSNALYELGRRDEARAAFDEVVRREPEAPNNRAVAASLAKFAKTHDEAAAHLERARASDIANVDEAASLAVLGIHAGDFSDAERLALKAIELDPKALRSYLDYAFLKEGEVPGAHLEALEEANRHGEFPPHLGGRLAFALGTIFEARGEIDKAFAAFSLGNERNFALAAAEGLVFDRAAERERTRGFIDFFKSRPQSIAFDDSAPAPIFVVGMPRSGTTLAESILAAHREVFGAGELVALNAVHRDVASWAADHPGAAPDDAPPEALQGWRARYLEGLPDHQGARAVVDKQPANHQSLGLVPLLFPEGKIVHMRRSPVETCFSIWRRDFSKTWTYANRFEDLAARYAEYARLTAHWETILGPEYLLVQYEDLVEDFDRTARRMAEHCGLDWRDEMRDFHQKKRMVLTFSATQVRRPINRDGLAKSAKYGPLLDPLRRALEAEGIDPGTGVFHG